MSSKSIVEMLLKSIEDLHGEQGVKNLIKIKDSEKNNSLMIAVQSGNVESAKVISFYLISIYLYIIYKWKRSGQDHFSYS